MSKTDSTKIGVT